MEAVEVGRGRTKSKFIFKPKKLGKIVYKVTSSREEYDHLLKFLKTFKYEHLQGLLDEWYFDGVISATDRDIFKTNC